MNPELLHVSPPELRAKLKAEAHKRRHAEAADALDFLVYGDENGRHTARCVHALAGGAACSRDYDPQPEPECAPADPSLYEGTGIGLLYGLPGSESHAWRLAGWNVGRRPQIDRQEPRP